MRDLVQAAKNYIQSLEGVTPHTHEQEACRMELRQAIANEENKPLEVKPEGHTSAGWTDDGTGRDKPKITLVEAMRQIEAAGKDMSAGMSTVPPIDDTDAPGIASLGLPDNTSLKSALDGQVAEQIGPEPPVGS